jgi:hypothetical protein
LHGLAADRTTWTPDFRLRFPATANLLRFVTPVLDLIVPGLTEPAATVQPAPTRRGPLSAPPAMDPNGAMCTPAADSICSAHTVPLAAELTEEISTHLAAAVAVFSPLFSSSARLPMPDVPSPSALGPLFQAEKALTAISQSLAHSATSFMSSDRALQARASYALWTTRALLALLGFERPSSSGTLAPEAVVERRRGIVLQASARADAAIESPSSASPTDILLHLAIASVAGLRQTSTAAHSQSPRLCLPSAAQYVSSHIVPLPPPPMRPRSALVIGESSHLTQLAIRPAAPIPGAPSHIEMFPGLEPQSLPKSADVGPFLLCDCLQLPHQWGPEDPRQPALPLELVRLPGPHFCTHPLVAPAHAAFSLMPLRG